MTFADFFRAVWKKDPFPWQETLAGKALKGEWPTSIGLPTAAGKTALIDIAVFALANRAPQSARRIFFVVDRRVIVDEAAERAGALAWTLCNAKPDSELFDLAQSLRELGGLEPLTTATLRGGIPRENGWADSPLQPVVICSTVDQLGSSLLFRAYGTSEYGRPIRAGLAANDSLIILDEAHTAGTFAETLAWIGRYRMRAEQPLQLPFTVVEMSATPRGNAFHESEEDRQHPVLKRRWEASKRTKLIAVDAKKDEDAAKGGFGGLIEALVGEARLMREQRAAKVIGVVVNRVATARQVHEQLVRDEGCDAVLLTGRSRPYDGDTIWEKWKPLIGLGRKADPDKPVFVIATQCIEVGANLDFDALVTEIASMDALEQRFGRLDRDGVQAEARGKTYAAVVAQKDQVAKKFEDAVYGASMPATWAWLQINLTTEMRTEELRANAGKKPKTRKVKEEFVEMGVMALRSTLKATKERDALRMPTQAAPVLMPSHVDLLCQTSPEPPVSPEPSVYLHGPETGPADVNVVWRADIDEENEERWREIVAVCAPSAAEALAVPLWAVRRWLAKQATSELADVEGLGDEASSARGNIPTVLDWRGAQESIPIRQVNDIRPGVTLVVPASYGGCDEWGWNPMSALEVFDVGDAVKLRAGRLMLRLHKCLAAQWKYPVLADKVRPAEREEPKEALRSLLDPDTSEWVKRVAECLLSSRRLRLISEPDGDDCVAIVGSAAFDQDDVRSSYTNEVGLDAHLDACAVVADAFACDLDLPVRRAVTRAAALHDIGKADPRFQAWLRGGNPIKPNELIAKSGKAGHNWAAIDRARRWSGYPKGGRHELTSVALLEGHHDEFPDVDFDLLLHLVGSHHGRCRPFAPIVEDADPCEVRYKEWDCASNHGLERPGSGICERFWRLTRRYGWYGLAYLEAIVRLSDHRQSQAEQDQDYAVGKGAHA